MDFENLEIKSVMTPLPYSIGIDKSLEVAKNMMAEHGIRHLPVDSSNTLVGVISERDINRALAPAGADPKRIDVDEIYIPEPYKVELNTKVSDVARYMAHEHIGCCLVVDEGKLKGIFTTVDACLALSEVLSGQLEQ